MWIFFLIYLISCAIIKSIETGVPYMYENLKKLRESLGLTQAEFGKSVGIAKTTYNNYETGIREPKSDFWISVAKKYGVTIDYLMGYSKDPHLTVDDENKKSPAPKHGVKEKELTPIEKELMGYVDQLSEEQKKLLLAQLKLLNEEDK